MTTTCFKLYPLLCCVLLAACADQPGKSELQTHEAQDSATSQLAAPVAPAASAEIAPAVAPSSPIALEKKAESARLYGSANKSFDVMDAPQSPAAGVSVDEMAYISPPAIVPIAEPSAENYANIKENRLQATKDNPVSTFSIDVDTAAYANVRRFLNNGQLPPTDAVRIEEMINYFDYDYAGPNSNNPPFQIHTEMAPSPWSSNSQLLQIGIKAYAPSETNQPRNLVFLLDVSGSMNEPNKLPLVKQAMRLLINQLNENDSLAIVVYAGSAGVVLPATRGNEKQTILQALNRLQAGGSTNGAQGILRAYEIAQQQFKKNGVNRVLLATDGDFNVGLSGTDELVRLIKQKKNSGIGLTVLGVGMGNYNDNMLEQISNAGDGNAAYIDTLQEAQKVLVTDVQATLQTVARDTKIQIEFNPQQVSSYRLIGYENRLLQQQDFTNDRVDAGDVGAGHSVTALYEITLAENTRYGKQSPANGNELGFLKLRYKPINASSSQEISQALLKSQIKPSLKQSSNNFRFAAAVAGFGQLLRHSEQIGDFSYQDALQLAQGSLGKDQYGYRNEFVQLLMQAEGLEQQRAEGPVANEPHRCRQLGYAVNRC